MMRIRNRNTINSQKSAHTSFEDIVICKGDKNLCLLGEKNLIKSGAFKTFFAYVTIPVRTIEDCLRHRLCTTINRKALAVALQPSKIIKSRLCL